MRHRRQYNASDDPRGVHTFAIKIFRMNLCTVCNCCRGLKSIHSTPIGDPKNNNLQCSLHTSRRLSPPFDKKNDILHSDQPQRKFYKSSVLPSPFVTSILAVPNVWSFSLPVMAAPPAVDPASISYVPSPMETPSWEIWVGFVAGVVPFIIASVEFGKRILIQRRCPECGGRGLVRRGKLLKKCTQCGGMLPWLGWKAFWFSTVTSPGNGGPLNQPKGQTSVFYKVPPPPPPVTSAHDDGKEASSVDAADET